MEQRAKRMLVWLGYVKERKREMWSASMLLLLWHICFASLSFKGFVHIVFCLLHLPLCCFNTYIYLCRRWWIEDPTLHYSICGVVVISCRLHLLAWNNRRNETNKTTILDSNSRPYFRVCVSECLPFSSGGVITPTLQTVPLFLLVFIHSHFLFWNELLSQLSKFENEILWAVSCVVIRLLPNTFGRL